jgi:hypothetical protein
VNAEWSGLRIQIQDFSPQSRKPSPPAAMPGQEVAKERKEFGK